MKVETGEGTPLVNPLVGPAISASESVRTREQILGADLTEMVRWLQGNRGVLYPQLDLNELGGAPTDPEEIRRLAFLKYKIRALEQAGLAFYISNGLADRYEYVSPTFRAKFGLTEEEAQALRVSEFAKRIFHPDDFTDLLKQMRTICREAKPGTSASLHLVSRVYLSDGRMIWLEQWGTTYFDERCRPAFSINCFHDITAQKSAEAERDRLLDCIVHDLRSPLTIFRGYLMLLQSQANGLSATHTEMLNRMMVACDKMTRMTNEMLSLEQVSHGNIEQELENVDLHEFLSSRLVDYRVMTTDKQIDFHFDCPQEIGVVRICTWMIEQVLENLVTNASKYSYRGSTVQMVVRRYSNAEIEIAVSDQGVGIPDSEKDKLFLEFSKISSTPTEGEPSTGLGLSICRRIVEKHGGRIWCESQLGVGSRFCFTVPLAVPHISH